ncbi:MAG: RagB/SusD family nutrient uptake outer membrane protein [Alistipes sp.]|nr:RagB/SusD family nutrient uptake outer membrane protein [Alistipes sp.]
MKNKILKYTSYIAVCGLVAGCNSYLDVIPDSRTEIDSPEKIAKLLVSAYPTSSSVMMFEYMSDNVVDNGLLYIYYNETQHESYQFEPFTATSQDTPYYNWEGCYSAISAANLALEAIDALENPSVCDAQRGEALMCRAWGHLQLAKIFCQPYNKVTSSTDLGIPYSTEIETTAINTYSRGTVEEVYRKIYEDIEEALPLIDDTEYSQPKYHFSRKAAYALAAEFNLYYGNYEKAVEYASFVLGDAPVLRDMTIIRALSSSTDIRNQYISSTEEANIMIQPTTSLACAYGFSAYTRYTHSQYLSNTETLGTAGPWGNSALWAYSGGIFGNNQQYIIPKMYGIFEVTNVLANTGYYHTVLTPFTTDRTVLNRAEAYAMLGRYDEAAADLNIWYSAKQNATTNIPASAIISYYRDEASPELIAKPFTETRLDIDLGGDQEYMLHAVLHARRIETLHEGVRFFDLKRFGIPYSKNSADKGTISLSAYDKRMAVQLPEGVISSGMEANPR